MSEEIRNTELEEREDVKAEVVVKESLGQKLLNGGKKAWTIVRKPLILVGAFVAGALVESKTGIFSGSSASYDEFEQVDTPETGSEG